MMESLIGGVRFGAGSLLRAPVFAGVSVLTLAIGVGATTAIFSMVHGVLLAPLPFEDPDALVDISEEMFGITTHEISAADLMWDFFQIHPLLVVPGDASCDGPVNAVDAALVLQFNAGLLGSLPCADGGDVNGDGEVTSIDAALILQFTAGLLDSLPV